MKPMHMYMSTLTIDGDLRRELTKYPAYLFFSDFEAHCHVLLPSGTQCELHQSEMFPNLNQLFNWLKLMESISCFSSSSCPIKLIKDKDKKIKHIIHYALYSECSEIRSV